jgi:flagellar hook-associated protein 3 FlgL
MINSFQTDSSAVEKVMEQMSSGQRLLLPSDEPVTNVRVSRLKREDAALTQYRSNITALKSRLQQNETALQGINQDMLQARDLMVWALNGSNTSEDINAMAASLVSLRDSIFYSSNSKDEEGRFLFSGTLTDTDTLKYDSTAAVGARYTYTGNAGIQNVVVGNGITQPANANLSEIADFLNKLDAAINQLQTPGVDINTSSVRPIVSTGLDSLDTTLASVSSKISAIGGEENLLATLDENHANVSLATQQAVLNLGSLDYAEASIRLNSYTAALQATQKAYSKISSLSLFAVL